MRTAAAVAVGSSPLVTFGALQMLGSGQAPQWQAISDDFLNPRFWLTLVVLLASGAFGGIAYELLLRKGAIELPHRVRRGAGGRAFKHAPSESLIALGIVGRALVGAAAAAAVLMVIAPSTAHSAIALGVTSGAAAPALIRLMRKQLLFAADALSRLSSHERSQARQPAPARQPVTSVA
jgi:hypothetical protein